MEMAALITAADLAGVRRLVDADPTSLDRAVATSGATPLIVATSESVRNHEIAAYLISKGAKLDLRDNAGWTALMNACRHDQPATAQLLVANGATLNLQNNNGWTALMFACLQPYEAHHTTAGMLRCVKICYAGGADLTTKHNAGEDALGVARRCNRRDAVTFLEFVTQSEVARALLGPLQQPPSVVVAFHEEGALTPEDCKQLSEDDLRGMGIAAAVARRKILAHFAEAGAAAVSKRPSLAKRVSQRLLGVGSKGTKQSYDAFLTHDWGTDELERENHLRVSQVNAALQEEKLNTWFDEDRLSGNVAQQIAAGIQGSRTCVVFVTQRYMEKLESPGGRDYCRDEFNMAADTLGVDKMIAVVMEPRMLDHSMWRGTLKLTLGTHLHIDFSTDEKVQENLSRLVERIKAA